MAENPTTGELFKAKAILKADVVAAVDAFMADSTTLSVFGEGYRIDRAAAVLLACQVGDDDSGRWSNRAPEAGGCAHGDSAGAAGEGVAQPMNMNVLALMAAITVFAGGLLIYALVHGEPFLMLAMVAFVAVAFAPWHKWL